MVKTDKKDIAASKGHAMQKAMPTTTRGLSSSVSSTTLVTRTALAYLEDAN